MNEKTVHSERVHDGSLLKLDILEVELSGGMRSRREIVRHIGAVASIVKTPADKYIFVRQFRKPAESVMLEIVAGCLNEGEDPEDCARREIREETGFDVIDITHLQTIYPTPGYSDEKLHLYTAEVGETASDLALDEDERIEVVELTEQEFEKMISDKQIYDGKTLAAWMMHKRSLR